MLSMKTSQYWISKELIHFSRSRDIFIETNVLIKTINGSVSLLIYIPRVEKKLIETTRMACFSLDTIPFTFPYWLIQYDVTDLWTLCIIRVAISTCEIEQHKNMQNFFHPLIQVKLCELNLLV